MPKKEKKWKVVLEDNKPKIYRKIGRFLIPLKRERGTKYIIKNDEKN